MSKNLFFSLLVLGIFAGSSFAHEIPIYPVTVELKVDQHRIRAKITNNVVYWREALLGKDCAQPKKWPEETVNKATDYINSHFQLFVDSQPLAGKLTAYRYQENPWLGSEKAKLVFQIEYPLPDEGMNVQLSGKIDFFSEVYQRFSKEKSQLDKEDKYEFEHSCVTCQEDTTQIFHTELLIRNQAETAVELNPDVPEFNLPLNQAMRTNWQNRWEAVGFSLSVLAGQLAFMLFILSGLLYPAISRKVLLTGLALFLLINISAFFLDGAGLMTLSHKTLLLSQWSVLILFNLTGLIRLPGAAWLILIGIAIPFWSASINTAFSQFGFSAQNITGFKLAFILGWCSFSIILGRLIVLGIHFWQRLLRKRSASLADKLFAQQSRFLQYLMILIAVYFISVIIRRG